MRTPSWQSWALGYTRGSQISEPSCEDATNLGGKRALDTHRRVTEQQ